MNLPAKRSFAEKYCRDIRRGMTRGAIRQGHFDLIRGAWKFAVPLVTSIVREESYPLARESEVDESETARAIEEYIDRDVLWLTVVTPPAPDENDSEPWWASRKAYRSTLSSRYDSGRLFPDTMRVRALDDYSNRKADDILKMISDLGYGAAKTVNKAVSGLHWSDDYLTPGYPLWYDTLYPLLASLTLTAAFDQRHETERCTRLAQASRKVLVLGERKSQRGAWLVLAKRNDAN